MCSLSLWAQTYSESYNIVSDAYNNKIENVKVIRNINGGTVIIPLFDESCPEELKAPFMYACKIVEEYLPSALPLKIKVSVDDVPTQFWKSISKVQTNILSEFGYSAGKSVTTSQIKGVIVAEMGTNANTTFRPYVPDVSFLTNIIDIEITYNKQLLTELSFSLDNNPEDKYDFISIALRDIIKGLGLSSDFKYDYINKELNQPARFLTDFERNINQALGEKNSPAVKLANATKGQLDIPYNSVKRLQLYAPSTWKNLISLNYFLPQEDSDVSNLLAHDFCRGMVYRSLSDNYNDVIFKQILGWIPSKASSTDSGSNYTSQGNTSMIMPYNGSMSITFDSSYSNQNSLIDFDESIPLATKSFDIDNENPELTEYIEAFHPFFIGDNEFYGNTGTSISILKKDGTWDLMELRAHSPSTSYNMSDWTFHFDESEYARTIDGYLRGRITYKRNGYYGSVFESKYFVLDYLPQKVTLKYKLESNDKASAINDINAALPQYAVRIYFSNIEGVEKIVLERLKEGARIPNKITITDVKKGYYETTVDRNTTFTAVAYNKNGASRGIPITVMLPSTNSSNINTRIENNIIRIEASSIKQTNFTYNIRSLDPYSNQTCLKGCTQDNIDISTLTDGYYVLLISEPNTSILKSIVFRKQ